MSHRKNTIVIDFSVLPKRPILEQMQEFIKDCLKIDMADVKSIQLHNLRNCVFVEFNSAGIATRIQKQYHLRHSYVYHGVEYFIPVYVDGPTITVKIHDLPPQMDNSVISIHMQQYGTVLSIQNDVWKHFFPGLPNGVRLVQMKLNKPVPSRIEIDKQSTYVSYPKENEKRSSQTSSNQANKKTNNDEERTPQTQSNTGEEQNKRSTVDSPSTKTSDDNDDDDGADDDASNNEDEPKNQTELAGKRRLSTETSNGVIVENDPKRPCSHSSPKPEKTSEWRVYQTRSKKKL